MKSQSYMTRALQARDPRYARILGKLGYEQPDMQAASLPSSSADADEPVDDIASLRAEYEHVVGKKAFHGWDADALREKIAAAQG